MLHYIFKSLGEKKNLVFNLFMWYLFLILVYLYFTRIPLKQKTYCLYCLWCCCVCSSSQKQMLHLDASRVAAWIYARQAVSVSPPCRFCIVVDCNDSQTHLLLIYVSSHMSEGQMIFYTCLPKKTKKKRWWCAWKMLSHLVINFYAVIFSMFV